MTAGAAIMTGRATANIPRACRGTAARGRSEARTPARTVNGGGEPWTITSGTKSYANLHGHGFQVVDNYQGSPATFVLKGTVSQNPS